MTSQQIYDQIGKSVPYQVGFNQRISGGREGLLLTTPPPKQVVLNEPPPALETKPTFNDVLTKTSIPIRTGTQPPQLLVTAKEQSAQPAQCPAPIVNCTPGEPKIVEKIVEVDRKVEKVNPKGLSNEDMNRKLFGILNSKPVDISCACEAYDYYSMTNPSQGEFKWNSDIEIVYREQPIIKHDNILEIMNNDNPNPWRKTKELTISYSRWSPNPNGKTPVRLLLIHDFLDSKESWWCTQKLLSPFFDTVSVDLIGTGESIMPRAVTSDEESENVPWSYMFHAQYLSALANTLWPGEQYYIAGIDFGGQIASTIASISKQVDGIIMINPPGFHRNTFPGIQYLDFYEMRKITSDESLNNLPISFTARVRDLLTGALKSSECDGRNNSTLKLILKQYTNLDRKRILIDQVVAFSQLPYQEYPKTDNNQQGLEIENITAATLIVTGQND